jgi:hypothetical protein
MGAYPFSNNGGYGTAHVASTPTTGLNGAGLSFISQNEFVAGSNSSPFTQSFTYSSTTGFGATRYTAVGASATRSVSAGFGVAFAAVTNAPRIRMWPTANPGFGTQYASPASTAENNQNTSLYGSGISHNANDVVMALVEAPKCHLVYRWTLAGGFGTKYTINNCVGSTSPGSGAVAWSPTGTELAVGHAGSPFISTFPWVTGTGPGTRFTSPATLPTGVVNSIAFGKSDIFVGHVSSPYLSVYPWSASGFGTKYANPSYGLTAANVQSVAYIDVLGYTLNALPYAFNGLTYSQSGVYYVSGYAEYENATELVMTDGLGTSRLQTVAFTAAGTYNEAYVQLDLGKASTINGIVVGTDYSANMGFTKVYAENKDLSVSSNGSSWTVVGNTGTFSSSIKTVSITPVSARYIKVSVASNPYDTFLPITQFYATTSSSYQFNGVITNLVRGRVNTASAGSFTFTGNAANLVKSTPTTSYTLTASTRSFVLTGIAAGLSVGRKVTAAQGTFNLTGITTGLKAGRVVTATTQSFSLIGIATGLKVTRTITGAVRTFALTGIANRLASIRTITATTQSFNLTGISSALRFNRTIAASYGTYGLTGIAARLVTSRTISAATTSFALTGQSAGLQFGHKVTASIASFALTGIPIRLATTRIVTASVRSFALNGIANQFFISRKIIAASNAFLLTGNQANLITTASKIILAAAGQFVLSGISSTLSKGSRALGSVGIFTVTRRPAGLTSTRIIVSGSGTFSLSGQSSTLAFGRKLSISSRQFAVSGIASNLFRTRSLYATPRQFLLTGNTAYLKTIHPPIICQAGAFTLPVLAAATRYSNSKVSQFPPRLEFNSTGKNVNLKPSRAIIGTMSFAMEQTACALRWHRI